MSQRVKNVDGLDRKTILGIVTNSRLASSKKKKYEQQKERPLGAANAINKYNKKRLCKGKSDATRTRIINRKEKKLYELL